MPNREKVIQGLEHCRSMCEGVSHNLCQGCLYQGKNDCADTLKTDALAMLKEQEARLLTIEEITGDGECWFEGINGACGYADCYMCTGSKEVELNRISMKPEYVSWNDFGKKWRCWSYRPTEEQRKTAKWND